jgi:hypothetical protein
MTSPIELDACNLGSITLRSSLNFSMTRRLISNAFGYTNSWYSWICGKSGFDPPGLRDRHSFSRGICPSYGAHTICIENNICFGKWGKDNI